MPRITLLTGASGMIGRLVFSQLPSPRVLTRDPAAAQAKLPGATALKWDGVSPPASSVFEDVDTVVHLMGEPVGEGRWTAAKKQRIRDSRVVSTRALVAAMATAPQRPSTLVSASAVGIYGDRGDDLLDERAAVGDGFLAEVCREWEREALAAETLGVRVVTVRIGIVLSRTGGALAKMLPLFKTGLAGPLGSGRQWMPWIHVDDVVGLLAHAVQCDGGGSQPALRGPLNAVAPAPVTNDEFTRALAAALHRPAFFRAPGAVLKLAFGELGSVVLASQRVVPRAAEQSGYAFGYPTLGGALTALLSAPASAAGLDPRAVAP